jgi:hypothetical protein
LKCFFSGDHRAGPGTRSDGAQGSPRRRGRLTRPAPRRAFLDLPLADFFASDPDGRLFAVRWIEGRELASRLFEMLAGYARLQVSGRSALASALGLPADFPSLTLILVSDAVGDAWADVASTLNIPIVGLRVHLLLDGAGDFAGCYFETRFATGGWRYDRAPGSASPRGPVRETRRRRSLNPLAVYPRDRNRWPPSFVRQPARPIRPPATKVPPRGTPPAVKTSRIPPRRLTDEERLPSACWKACLPQSPDPAGGVRFPPPFASLGGIDLLATSRQRTMSMSGVSG